MRFEQQPGLMDRRRLLVAFGAGVLVASALYVALETSDHETGFNFVQNNGESSADSYEKLPVHENIITTVFWVGEGADSSNDFIHNSSSAWTGNWVSAFGGVDDPEHRCGYKPCGFEPKENPFYFALPFNDYNDQGRKPPAELAVIPWYDGQLGEYESYLKNHWVEVTYADKTAYAQWEDVGPFGEDDAGYVFGTDPPKESRAGFDVSPAVADFLGFDGRAETSWKFVPASEVPPGPWTEIVTVSNPQW